ncbi:MAG: cytochrome c oxidase cbb3-type subunit 2 [Lentimonas sp.]|jgi:cytochrome c oxidase cbb3-type subunit 2
MKHFPVLFLFVLSGLALPFLGLVLSSYIQLGSLERMTENLSLDDEGNPIEGKPIEGEPLFPRKLPGVAQQGKAVYADLGCVYCHTQQVRRPDYGADIERDWGKRVTVARDYVTQKRALIGNLRIGPDLTTIGERQLDANWHHLLLYNPQTAFEGTSSMPRYPFLYKVQEVEGAPSANALQFEPDSKYAPKKGYEVVPTKRAEVLVEYLLSLKLDYSLPEAKIIEE